MPGVAQQLFSQYGNGPAKNGAEVLAFVEAMKSAGLTDAEACVLGAWVGGAPAEHFAGYKFWNNTFRQTAPEACKTGVAVDVALAVLRKLDAKLAELVDAKAQNKQFKEDVNEAENVQQDIDKLKARASDALSFDLFGVQVTPAKLAAAALVVVGVVVAVRLVGTTRAVVG